MHYYQFNIADYRKDTTHLNRLEHGIYRDLIDWYYLDEAPISLETQWVMRRLRLETEQEEKALNNVLKDFFEKRETGFHHKRIDTDIEKYRKDCEKNKQNGMKGGRPKANNNPLGFESIPNENPNESQINPNQEPLTINQEPIETLLSPSNEGRPPNVPVQEILNAYHEILPELTAVKVMNEKRSKALRQRWREDKKRQNIAWWRKYFNYVKKSDFLMGRKIINGNQWSADFEWLIGSSNLVKVIEGKYHYE